MQKYGRENFVFLDNFIRMTIPYITKDREGMRTPTSSLQATPPVTPPVDDLILKALLALKTGDKGNAELLLDIGINDRKRLRERYLKPAIEMGYIVPTMPDNPRSPTQKYRLTEKGRSVVDED